MLWSDVPDTDQHFFPGIMRRRAGSSNGNQDSQSSGETAVDLEGKQLIEVVAKSGGYYPGSIDAKADTPTVLRIKSENAYGCERAFRMPELRIGATLPINGDTDIEIGSFEAGTRLLGVCSMGMYGFYIYFK